MPTADLSNALSDYQVCLFWAPKRGRRRVPHMWVRSLGCGRLPACLPAPACSSVHQIGHQGCLDRRRVEVMGRALGHERALLRHRGEAGGRRKNSAGASHASARRRWGDHSRRRNDHSRRHPRYLPKVLRAHVDTSLRRRHATWRHGQARARGSEIPGALEFSSPSVSAEPQHWKPCGLEFRVS